MKKILILGSNPFKVGFGSALIEQFKNSEFEVDSVCRSIVDLGSDGWFDKCITDKKYDIIIVNGFDYKYPNVQLSVFKLLFEKFKNTEDIQLIVIGSMSHYFKQENSYEIAKKELHDYFINVGKDSLNYKCKLLMVEPGSMENRLPYKDKYTFTYSTLAETAKIVYEVSKLNLKFMSLSLRGNKRSNEYGE